MDSIDLFIRTLSFIAPLPEKLRERFSRQIIREKSTRKTLMLREGKPPPKFILSTHALRGRFIIPRQKRMHRVVYGPGLFYDLRIQLFHPAARSRKHRDLGEQ